MAARGPSTQLTHYPILQKAANGVVQRRGTSIATDAGADAERGIGRYLQALVSRPGHEGRGDAARGLAPSISMLSTLHPGCSTRATAERSVIRPTARVYGASVA